MVNNKELSMTLYKDTASGPLTVGETIRFYLVVRYFEEEASLPDQFFEGVSDHTFMMLRMPDNNSFEFVPGNDLLEAALLTGGPWKDVHEIDDLSSAFELLANLFISYRTRPLGENGQVVKLFGELLDNFLDQLIYSQGEEPDPTIFCDTCGDQVLTFAVPGERCQLFPGFRLTFDLKFNTTGAHTRPYFVQTTGVNFNCLTPEIIGLNTSATINIGSSANEGTLDIQTVGANGEIFVDGTSEGSGSVTKNFSVGTHVISFGSVNGFLTPSTRTVKVEEDTTTNVTATYVDDTCTYEVTPNTVFAPPEGRHRLLL